MSDLKRRNFLKTAGIAGTAFAISTSAKKVLGANETVRVAVTGIHGRGGNHIDNYQKMDNVEVVCLIDPDSRTFDRRIKQVEGLGGKTPATYQDIREALDKTEFDALSIATTNHWHSLSTIYACEAGRDVYVEKPLSHNVHEGRIAVDMARKHNRIVQHGTQSRSSRLWTKLAAHAKKGTFGKLLVSRGIVYKRRQSIGFKSAEQPPKELAYNIWLGPAPEQPYNTNLVHYNWHWFWDFGNGDIGNQGVHQMDIARWMIPNGTYPKSAVCVGGRFGYYDQGETPNTQVALFDYGETKLIFEVRGLESENYMGAGNSDDVMHFEEGTIVSGRKFIPKGQTKAAKMPDIEVDMNPGESHYSNFIEAVRSRKQDELNAEVMDGHLSCIPIHLANISYRLGEKVAYENKMKPFADDDANEAFDRMIGHLKENNIDPAWMSYNLGPSLKFDEKTESITNNKAANLMLTRDERQPFAVPKKV